MKKLIIGFALFGTVAFVGAGRVLAADNAAAGGDQAAAAGGGGDDANTQYKAKTSTTSKTTRSKATCSGRTARTSPPTARPSIRA